MQLSADQIVEGTIGPRMRSPIWWIGYCGPNTVKSTRPSIRTWQDETRHRIADMESGRVQGMPLDETLAKVSEITGQ
jgi:hypothetical protein